jgi:hypothetical protein
MEDIPLSDSAEGTLLGLPESQDEIDVSSCRFSLIKKANTFFIYSEFNRIQYSP